MFRNKKKDTGSDVLPNSRRVVPGDSIGVAARNSSGAASRNSSSVVPHNSSGVAGPKSSGVASRNSSGVVPRNSSGVAGPNSSSEDSRNSSGVSALDSPSSQVRDACEENSLLPAILASFQKKAHSLKLY